MTRFDESADAPEAETRALAAGRSRAAAPRLLAASSILLVASGLAACGGPSPPSHEDAAVLLEPDAALLTVDSDGDGLCDATEIARNTDPFLADTDGDGFPDLVELQIGSDPRSRSSPNRTQIVALPTDRIFSASTLLSYDVRAEGGDYVGGFTARARPYGGPTSANDFFLRAFAVSTAPTGNASAIEEERFRGVVGRTRLTYQIDFEYRDRDGFVDCMELYPFAYQVKLENVGLVGYQPRLLLVGPRAMSPGNGEWCVPASCY